MENKEFKTNTEWKEIYRKLLEDEKTEIRHSPIEKPSSEKINTNCKGFTIKAFKNITKKEFIELCNNLAHTFNNYYKRTEYSFRPECITEGGIEFDNFHRPNKKTMRMRFIDYENNRMFRGDFRLYGWIFDNIKKVWINDETILINKNEYIDTHLKSFGDAPKWIIQELEIFKDCFQKIGLKIINLPYEFQNGKYSELFNEKWICKNNGKWVDYGEKWVKNDLCEHDKQKQYCKKCDGSKLCKSSWCEKQVNKKKYEGYCLTCVIQVRPDIEVSRNYKTKENHVVDRINQTYPNLDWVADKRVYDGCSKRRPDLLLDLGSHIIITEVDENKHQEYDCSCENKRLMELSLDLGHRPIVFIRFNPDAYTNQQGEKIKSCWKLNKLGVMTIAPRKEKEWEERISILKEQIQYWIDNSPTKTVEIVELFY